jgi:hypothetical protein
MLPILRLVSGSSAGVPRAEWIADHMQAMTPAIRRAWLDVVWVMITGQEHAPDVETADPLTCARVLAVCLRALPRQTRSAVCEAWMIDHRLMRIAPPRARASVARVRAASVAGVRDQAAATQHQRR